MLLDICFLSETASHTHVGNLHNTPFVLLLHGAISIALIFTVFPELVLMSICRAEDLSANVRKCVQMP